MGHNIARYFTGNPTSAPKVVFGDNDVDKNRISKSRQHNAGQAEWVGPYDRSFGYGIVTTFYAQSSEKMHAHSSPFQGRQSPQKFTISAFRQQMNVQFAPLMTHLQSGHDVIIPAPSKEDLSGQNAGKYRNIGHNLGTGIANLPEAYLLCIQRKIEELKACARRVECIAFPKMYGVNGRTVRNGSSQSSSKIKEMHKQSNTIQSPRKIQNNLQNGLQNGLQSSVPKQVISQVARSVSSKSADMSTPRRRLKFQSFEGHSPVTPVRTAIQPIKSKISTPEQ